MFETAELESNSNDLLTIDRINSIITLLKNNISINILFIIIFFIQF